MLAVSSLDRRAADVSAHSRLALRRRTLSGTLIDCYRRLVACLVLQQHWRRLQRLLWIDKVAASVPGLHGFPHRLGTNFKALLPKFEGGLDAIERIKATRRFLCRRTPLPLCPECGKYALRSSVYQQLGDKMARSTPFLFFGCGPCCDGYASDPWNGEYSQLRWTFLEDASWSRPICMEFARA